MKLEAPIIEIFSSIQGEGTHVGERQLFVRFQDCELSCKFCDTPLSFVNNKFCRVEFPPFSGRFKHLPNPIPLELLNQTLGEFDDKVLTITGGEPLQQTIFLSQWLPTIRPRFKIMLETAGIHFGEFRDIAPFIDIVSMDFKLPSSTGMHPWWREHESFLKAAKGKEVYIKMILTAETEEKDIQRATELISSIDPSLWIILQPATTFGRFRAVPSMEQVARSQSLIQKTLLNVRVISQLHKQLGIL